MANKGSSTASDAKTRTNEKSIFSFGQNNFGLFGGTFRNRNIFSTFVFFTTLHSTTFVRSPPGGDNLEGKKCWQLKKIPKIKNNKNKIKN